MICTIMQANNKWYYFTEDVTSEPYSARRAAKRAARRVFGGCIFVTLPVGKRAGKYKDDKRQYRQRYYKANKEKRLALSRKWQNKNPDKILSYLYKKIEEDPYCNLDYYEKLIKITERAVSLDEPNKYGKDLYEYVWKDERIAVAK